MSPRTIRGSSLRDALSRVRAELGAGAIVIETRALPQARSGEGTPYEILAAPDDLSLSHSERDRLEGFDDMSMLLHTLTGELRNIHAIVETQPEMPGDRAMAVIEGQLGELRTALHRLGQQVTDGLDRNHSSDPFVHQLVIGGVEPVLARILSERARARAAPRHGLGLARVPDVGAELARALAVTGPLWARDGRATVAFVGPTGVGKTRTIAKLATLTTFVHNRPVGVISTDINRIGGTETLEELSAIAGIDYEVAGDARALDRAVRAMGGHRLILVDTAGVSPWDDAGLLATDHLLADASVERHLVLAADTSADRARLIGRRFGGSHLRSLVVTKVDESAGPGSVLSSVWGTGLPVSQICDGQEIPHTCHEINPERWSESVTGTHG
jgi:flagellar biosynthesis protein FlhF